jgi:dienelactone hydrolase
MKKKILKVFVFLILVVVLSAGVWVNLTYEPTQNALSYMVSTEKVGVVEEDFGLSFIPLEKNNSTGIIFYPGAKVEPEAYSSLCHQLAEKGYQVTIVEMPFNLAVMDVDRGRRVMTHYKKIEEWYIGGHSLGGAMAGSFALEFNELIEGVFFLGAYPIEDFSDVSIDVLLINGSLDTIIDKNRLEEAKDLIPQNSRNITIKGGNHSQFGSYGLQKNDQPAEITNEEQQEQTVQLIIELLKN